MTPEELDEKLAHLPADAPPPPGLEDRVVAELRRRGAFRRPRRVTPWAIAAAAMLLAVAGFVAGRRTAPPPPAFSYVLLLHEDARFQDAPGGHVDEYRRWAADVRRRGVRISGTKLADAVVMLDDGAAGADRTTGYFTVDAASLGEALAIARSCPHLRHGGRIEVRAIERT